MKNLIHKQQGQGSDSSSDASSTSESSTKKKKKDKKDKARIKLIKKGNRARISQRGQVGDQLPAG